MIRVLVAIGGTAIVFAAALIGGELFGAWEPAKRRKVRTVSGQVPIVLAASWRGQPSL
jgi:hypothetical protein